MNHIGIVVRFGNVGKDQKAGATVKSVAVGQVFTDDMIGEMAGAAHDALLNIPGVRANFEHLQVVIGLKNEAIRIAQMEFDELGEVAEVGNDGDFGTVGAKGVADGIGGVVRDSEGRNFDVANGEFFAGADMFDAIEFFGGRLGQNAKNFGVGSFGEIGGGTPVSEKLRKAARVVGVFVRDENAIDAFGRFLEGSEAAKSFFAAEASVDQEAGALSFKQCGIARTARGQDGDSKADRPSRAARCDRWSARLAMHDDKGGKLRQWNSAEKCEKVTTRRKNRGFSRRGGRPGVGSR